MAKKRDRYLVTGNIRLNDVDIRGVILVYIGPCGYAGVTKQKDGSKLLKNDLKYSKFKFEDPKVVKDLGLSRSFNEFSFTENEVSTFLTLQNEDNT